MKALRTPLACIAATLLIAAAPDPLSIGEEVPAPELGEDRPDGDQASVPQNQSAGQDQAQPDAPAPLNSLYSPEGAQATGQRAPGDDREGEGPRPPSRWPEIVMALAAVATVFISLWAVLLLKFTLKATRDAVDEAAKATAAAGVANEIARRAVVQAGRPWIRIDFPDTLGAMQVVTAGAPEVQTSFDMRYDNIGQQPAVAVRLKHWLIRDDATPDEQRLASYADEAKAASRSKKGLVLYPGQPKDITVGSTAPIDASQGRLYLVVAIAYRAPGHDETFATCHAYGVGRLGGGANLFPACVFAD